MALNTTKLGPGGVNSLFKLYYGRDATQDELNYWSNKSDAELRPKLVPNSEVQLAKNKASDGLTDQERADKIKYDEAEAANPIVAAVAEKNGSTTAEIIDAILKGDLNGLVDWEGKPYSLEDQQKALSDADESTKLFYEQQQEKETADAEATLAQKQADYQDYLINSGDAFQADKSRSDQIAANSGVLFSGGRVQKEKNLQRAYEQDQATKQRDLANSIGTTARDFQYKYGNDAANGLSQYYQAGGNTFNPNVATGGVGQKSLSNVYNPSSYNFYGTRKKERALDNATRSAGYLWNKGNKLLSTGYNNQYN